MAVTTPALSVNKLRGFTLPSPPSVAYTLLDMLSDPNVTLQELAGVVAVDPMIAARLLKVANSSLYAQSSPVTTIERAVLLLGLNYVKVLCLAQQLAGPLAALKFGGERTEAHWRNALLRACVARCLARRIRRGDPECAFLVGLLQDTGIPVLAQTAGDAYLKLLDDAGPHQAKLVAGERELLGRTHAEVGATVLKQWKLPPLITDSIARHHDPADGSAEDVPVAMQHIAHFVGMLPIGADDVLDPDSDSSPNLGPTIALLGLDGESVGAALRFGKNECQTISNLFERLLPDDIDVEGVLRQTCEAMSTVEPKLFQAAFPAS